MSMGKQVRLELAVESLAMAQKILAKFTDGQVPVSEFSKFQDAAIQAMQATQPLNQLLGMLDVEASR